MNDLDTKTIINFLPFDTSYKLTLLEKFDTLSTQEQNRISTIVWEAFYSFYDLKIKENFDKLTEEFEKQGIKPDESFYSQVVAKTDEEMQAALTSAGESTDLSAARKSMEQIVQAINLSKTPSNPQKLN